MFLHPVSSIHYYSCSEQQLCVFLCGNRAKTMVESCRSFESSTFELTECEDASSQRRNPLTGCPHSDDKRFQVSPLSCVFYISTFCRARFVVILSCQLCCANFVAPSSAKSCSWPQAAKASTDMLASGEFSLRFH